MMLDVLKDEVVALVLMDLLKAIGRTVMVQRTENVLFVERLITLLKIAIGSTVFLLIMGEVLLLTTLLLNPWRRGKMLMTTKVLRVMAMISLSPRSSTLS
jgi:hypothetical protein